MHDLAPWPQTNRHVAAATALQLYGGLDPDGSRDLAERVVFAIDRAGARGHTGSAPTGDEIRRAHNALARRGVVATSDDVAYALNEAFVYGWPDE
jgi:hypothetical protein